MPYHFSIFFQRFALPTGLFTLYYLYVTSYKIYLGRMKCKSTHWFDILFGIEMEVLIIFEDLVFLTMDVKQLPNGVKVWFLFSSFFHIMLLIMFIIYSIWITQSWYNILRKFEVEFAENLRMPSFNLKNVVLIKKNTYPYVSDVC